jgi:hypothetical protein
MKEMRGTEDCERMKNKILLKMKNKIRAREREKDTVNRDTGESETKIAERERPLE